MKITVTVIKADVGGIGGHTRPSDGLLNAVRNLVKPQVRKDGKGLLIDSYIGYCGDDIHIVMTHTKGVNNSQVHGLAWRAFEAATRVAKSEGLYGAGQDLLKDSFSGNVKGMGPGVAEMTFDERPNEAFTIYAADKTEPGAFNYPFYRMFVDTLSNTGLIVNQNLSKGVRISVMDVEKGKIATLNMWEDKPTLEAALMYPGRYVVSTVTTKDNQPILAASTDRLHNIAGTYVGKDDPICIIRTQKDFPATEEAGAAFNNPHLVAGNTRGSHHMPLMPVKLNSPASINYAIPIVSALVFSMHNGILTGPVDGFESVDWDYVRNIAMRRAMAIRSQGFVHPATLVPDELEYGVGYRARMSILWSRMRPIPGASPNVKQGQKPNQNNKPQQKQGQKPQQGQRPPQQNQQRPGQKPQQGQRPPQQGQKSQQNQQRPQQKQQQGNRPQQGQRPGQKPNQGNRPQQNNRPQQGQQQKQGQRPQQQNQQRPGQKPQQGQRPPQQGQRPQGQHPQQKQQGNRPQQGQRPQQQGQKPQQNQQRPQGQRPPQQQKPQTPKPQTAPNTQVKSESKSTEVKVKKPRAPRKKKTDTATTKPAESTVSTTSTPKTETST
ncbi:Fructose-1,6-bisphosphatase [Nitrosotalea devaniterrae]|uniref:Fructose-1,6-bisphosphate aldolase/phosphatase n=1 Tax=Nitrosotalea devaniterrae TaxID=1078905 RepID=A0A128A387_9ARCH|nr:Fructose-1,6-bisphosphatase [Candidatus Nitrosotalea devanaterra]